MTPPLRYDQLTPIKQQEIQKNLDKLQAAGVGDDEIEDYLRNGEHLLLPGDEPPKPTIQVDPKSVPMGAAALPNVAMAAAESTGRGDSLRHGAGRDFGGPKPPPATFAEHTLDTVPFATKLSALARAAEEYTQSRTDLRPNRGPPKPWDYSGIKKEREEAIDEYGKEHPVLGATSTALGYLLPAALTMGGSLEATAPEAALGAGKAFLGKVADMVDAGIVGGALQGASDADWSHPMEAINRSVKQAAWSGALAPVLGYPLGKFGGYVAGKMAGPASQLAEEGAGKLAARRLAKDAARLNPVEGQMFNQRPAGTGLDDWVAAVKRAVDAQRTEPGTIENFLRNASNVMGEKGRAAQAIATPVGYDERGGSPITPPAPGFPNMPLNQGGPNLTASVGRAAREQGEARSVVQRAMNEQVAERPKALSEAAEKVTEAGRDAGTDQLYQSLAEGRQEVNAAYDRARQETAGQAVISPTWESLKKTPLGQEADRFARTAIENRQKQLPKALVWKGEMEPGATIPEFEKMPTGEPWPEPPYSGAPELSDIAKSTLEANKAKFEKFYNTKWDEASPKGKEAFEQQVLAEMQKAGQQIYKGQGDVEYSREVKNLASQMLSSPQKPEGFTPQQAIQQAVETAQKAGRPTIVPKGSEGTQGPPIPKLSEITVPDPEYLHFVKVFLNREATRGGEAAGKNGPLATRGFEAAQAADQIRQELAERAPSYVAADQLYGRLQDLYDMQNRGQNVFNTPEIPRSKYARDAVKGSLNQLERDAASRPDFGAAARSGAGAAINARMNRAISGLEGRPSGRIGRYFPETGVTARQAQFGMVQPKPEDLSSIIQGGAINRPTPQEEFYQTLAGWNQAANQYQKILGGSPSQERLDEPPVGALAKAPGFIWHVARGEPASAAAALATRGARGAANAANAASQRAMNEAVARRITDRTQTLPDILKDAQTRQDLIQYLNQYFPTAVGMESAKRRDRNDQP